MPMSEDEKIEKVQRLLIAHKKTKEALENDPVGWDVHRGSDIARNWTVITAAYSGLEQTLKYLIAEEKSKSIAELIEFSKRKRCPYRRRDRSELFAKLDEPTQDIVRDFYERFIGPRETKRYRADDCGHHGRRCAHLPGRDRHAELHGPDTGR